MNIRETIINNSGAVISPLCASMFSVFFRFLYLCLFFCLCISHVCERSFFMLVIVLVLISRCKHSFFMLVLLLVLISCVRTTFLYGSCVILLLLDLSAAFDTDDHAILLSRLRDRFGVSGTALAWFQSYLSDRSQFVSIDGKRSSKRGLSCGVPQGSVLGPLPYLLYTSPLGDICQKHGLSFHLHADDTQIYIIFKPLVNGSLECSKNLFQECSRDMSIWMKKNKLKLNDDKTNFLVLTARHRPQPQIESVVVELTLFFHLKQ